MSTGYLSFPFIFSYVHILFKLTEDRDSIIFSTVIILILAPTDSVCLWASHFTFLPLFFLSVKERVKHFKNIQHCREPSVSTVLFGSSYNLGED